MEENSGSESKSIIDFDDEYSENENNNDNENEKEKENIITQNQKINLEDANEQIGQSKHNNQQQEEEHEQENQEILAQEEEEQIENSSEENIIYDPKIKELNEIDINNKQAIIDILMQDILISKKPLKNEASMKEKTKNKFAYVESTMNKNNGENSSKKNLYGRVGYQIEAQEGDPQFVKDINVAAYLLKDQIQEENQDVAKLLFDDLAPTPNNKKMITRKQIGEKVKKTLEKKRKNLEKIEAKMYEEQKSQETFTPLINHRKKDAIKRDFNSFLKDQNEFQKRVELKKQNIIQRNEEDIKELNIGRPQVNKTSEELVKKISASDEPVYMRLYNKRVNNEKLKEAEEKRIIQEKEEEKKRKERENELKKNNPYKHIKSKINILKKSPSQAGVEPIKEGELSKNNMNGRIRVPFNRNSKSLNKREKSAVILRNNYNKKLFDIKDLPTNKMLWNKFIKNFDEALININENNSNSNNEINLEELNEYQYHKLLYYLGMVVYPPEHKEKNGEENKINEEQKEEENNRQEEMTPEVENMLKVDENKLINDSFNLLRLDQDKIRTIDIKNFLIFVLDNQNYDLYQQYKTNHEQEIKDLFPLNKYKKEDIPELILKKQNEELLSNIDKTNKLNNKYFSLSKDNKIIFTLDKSQNIKKDFNMLGLNYRNKRKKGKEEKILNIIKQKYPFKPTINVKSEKLYQKYKDKIYPVQNETVTSNSQFKKSNMEYIDRILLLDKKRIAENQKIKEELQKKEIKECTFKPKINQSYPLAKKINKDLNDENQNITNNKTENVSKNGKKSKSKNKFEELYEIGKNKIQAKKNKSREEIELERQRNECTFQPNINNLNIQKIPKTNFTNDIYNEKEYKYLYERLKHGRLERMVKDSNNDRYGLNNELKQFVKDNKEFNFIQNQAYLGLEDQYYNSNNNQMKYDNNYNVNNEERENYNKQEDNVNIKNENNNNSQTQQNNQEEGGSENEGDPEKKEEIPLLIIDVNIRQGVKKKIYVYEGDTPEDLAEKFAKEQNLEPESKNKLQSLIQSHMLRLLTRIEEENQSISEKSQNLHNQKIN